MNNDATITTASIICRAQNLLAAEMDGEVVLMSMEGGKYFGLDDIATDIWNRLERPVSVGELCVALATEYEADQSVIENDVRHWAEEMRKNGLVEFTA